MEQTLSIIKPDAVKKNVIGKIISRFEENALRIVALKKVFLSKNDAQKFYAIHKDRPFFTAPLSCDPKLGSGLGTGGGHAYRDGSFILVSDSGKSLCTDGIKHVIVNDAYYHIISDLRRRFPKVNFVRADEAVEYFSRL